MELQLHTTTLAGPVGEVLVVAVCGEVDLRTAPQLSDHLAELDPTALGTSGRVVLDLSQVGFLDSSGLGVLVAAHKTLVAAGGTLHLAQPQPHVAKVLRITRLPDVVPTFDTVEAACR